MNRREAMQTTAVTIGAMALPSVASEPDQPKSDAKQKILRNPVSKETYTEFSNRLLLPRDKIHEGDEVFVDTYYWNPKTGGLERYTGPVTVLHTHTGNETFKVTIPGIDSPAGHMVGWAASSAVNLLEFCLLLDIEHSQQAQNEYDYHLEMASRFGIYFHIPSSPSPCWEKPS